MNINKKIIVLCFLTIISYLEAQTDPNKDVFDFAYELYNASEFEGSLDQLDYYKELSGNKTTAKADALYALNWAFLDSFFLSNQYLKEYFKKATKEHKDYSAMLSLQKSSEKLLSKETDFIKEIIAGTTVGENKYDWEAHSGLLPMALPPSFKLCGYVNKSGEIVIPFNYRYASSFNQGRAVVQGYFDDVKKIINTKGEVIAKIPGHYTVVYPFQEKTAIAKKQFDSTKGNLEVSQYGLINDEGEEIVDLIAKKEGKLYTVFGGGFLKNDIFVDTNKVPILVDGKYGFVNKKGEYIVKYDDYLDRIYTKSNIKEYSFPYNKPTLNKFQSRYFHNVALVYNKKNSPNSVVIGFGSAPSKKQTFSILNKEGKEKFGTSYSGMSPFIDGYSICQERRIGKKGGYTVSGVINTKNEIVVPIEYLAITRSKTKGQFILHKNKKDINRECNVIDAKTGVKLPRPVPMLYNDEIFVPCVSQDIFPVLNKNGKLSYYNKNLDKIFPEAYENAKCFSEGLAVVKNKKNGFIDKKGDVVIPLEYDVALSFSNGLAAVGKGDSGIEKWGFINKKGEQIISFKYDYVEPFFDANQILLNYYNYRDIIESTIPLDNEFSPFDITFNPNEPFLNLIRNKKIALVKLKDKMQFIDIEGNILLERKWEELDIVKPGKGEKI